MTSRARGRERTLLGQICLELALPRDDPSLRAHLCTDADSLLLDLHPEIAVLRDLAFWAKAASHPSADALPEAHPHAVGDARLVWRLKDDKLTVRAFGAPLHAAGWVDADEQDEWAADAAAAAGPANPKQHGLLQRLLGRVPRPRLPPSAADPSHLAGAPLASEDDVLHLRHLPDFGGLTKLADGTPDLAPGPLAPGPWP